MTERDNNNKNTQTNYPGKNAENGRSNLTGSEKSGPRVENESSSPRSRESYQNLGQKGGEATAATHDREFYQEIGRKGGEATAASHDKGFYQEIGQKGGEARAAQMEANDKKKREQNEHDNEKDKMKSNKK